MSIDKKQHKQHNQMRLILSLIALTAVICSLSCKPVPINDRTAERQGSSEGTYQEGYDQAMKRLNDGYPAYKLYKSANFSRYPNDHTNGIKSACLEFMKDHPAE